MAKINPLQTKTLMFYAWAMLVYCTILLSDCLLPNIRVEEPFVSVQTYNSPLGKRGSHFSVICTTNRSFLPSNDTDYNRLLFHDIEKKEFKIDYTAILGFVTRYVDDYDEHFYITYITGYDYQFIQIFYLVGIVCSLLIILFKSDYVRLFAALGLRFAFFFSLIWFLIFILPLLVLHCT